MLSVAPILLYNNVTAAISDSSTIGTSCQVEVLLGIRELPDPRRGFGDLKALAKLASELQEESGQVEGKKIAVFSDKGDDLAAELATKATHAARRIIGERFMAIVIPQLSWTKTGQRVAGQTTEYMLRCLVDDQSFATGEPSEALRKMCHLTFHSSQLMDKVTSPPPPHLRCPVNNLWFVIVHLK